MPIEKNKTGTNKPTAEEEDILNMMHQNKSSGLPSPEQQNEMPKDTKPKERTRQGHSKKLDYEDTFLSNRYSSGRNGKVVYIRPDYHERLLRIVQLAREDKVTLYGYIDNILEQHFKEYGDDITNYFNERFKPIL